MGRSESWGDDDLGLLTSIGIGMLRVRNVRGQTTRHTDHANDARDDEVMN